MKIIPYLQKIGYSRRNITQMIDTGDITLNGKHIESYTHSLQPHDIITINKKKHHYTGKEQTPARMIVFHKPIGYVVSKSDPHNTTIYDILPKEFSQRYYIGRLDKNSSGLLLLTNDSSIVHQYEHPKFGIEKEYIVQSAYPLSSKQIRQIKKGVQEGGELLAVVDITVLNKQTYTIILNQGKKRHIRRIFKTMNNKVIHLQRTREGQISLGNLAVGTWKEITPPA